MANLNSCTFSGRLAKDPESKQLDSGKTVTKFSIGVSGYSKDETSWIDCVTWEKTAEVASTYLRKGSYVVVQGRLKQRTWEKDGVKRSAYELTVNDLDLGPKTDSAPKSRGGWDD